MKLYHLDRTGTFPVGKPLLLHSLSELPDEARNTVFVQEFISGISSHGKQYLDNTVPGIPRISVTNSNIKFIDETSFLNRKSFLGSQIIEFIFELVRRIHFPQMSSRFVSLFCVDNLSEFEKWPELNSNSNKRIFEIDAPDTLQRFDSNFLRGGLAFSASSNYAYLGMLPAQDFDLAYKYWSGSSTPSPRWEYIVPLPIEANRIKLLTP